MAIERYAVVKDAKVINVIMLDLEANPGFEVDGELIACDGDTYVGPGFEYNGHEFVDTRVEPLPITLEETKRNALVTIDAQYRNLQASLFADDMVREKMRHSALATVQAIRDAATEIDVSTALANGIKELQSLVQPG